MVPLWLLIGIVIWLGFHFDIDGRVIAGGVVTTQVRQTAFEFMVL
jgi:hypothetical protein